MQTRELVKDKLAARRRRRAQHVTACAVVKLKGDGLLRLPEVLALLGISRSSWYAGIREGIYPGSTLIGMRSVAWRCADIRELLGIKEVD